MSGRRIVLSTWGSFGDLHPYVALAIELKRRGHDPAIATLPAFRERVAAAGIGFHPAGPDVPPDDRGTRDLVRRVLHPQLGPPFLFQRILGPYTRRSYDEVLAAVRANGGADLLVSHQVPLTGPIVAETTGMKWVSAVLTPMAFLSIYDPPTPPQWPALRTVTALHPAMARALNCIGRAATRSWMSPVQRLRAELGLPADDHPLFEGQHSPWLVLALFSPVFGRKQPDFPPQALITGFPFYDAAREDPAPPELLRFLDAGEPPLLFTLGSSARLIAGDFYRISIDAAVALGERAVLLAVGDAARLRQEKLPAKVAAFDYAPHSVVMPRARVIVHHGGIGTTAQALAAGRPMLIVPFGQDQPDNARRCVDLGIAKTVPRKSYTLPRIVAELRALTSDSSYAQRATAVAARVKTERGTITACDAIERVLDQ